MDAAAQAEGEKRVMALLFDPLEGLGLGKPTTTNKAGYEKMKRMVCGCLAHLTEAQLGELREWAQAHPGGPQKDRVPNGQVLLARVKDTTRPTGGKSVSPLMQEVFSNQLGADAIKGGWAPELMKWFRVVPLGERKWPQGYTVSQIKKDAYQSIRRQRDIQMRLDRRDAISAEDQAFYDGREAAMQECRDVRKQNTKGAAA
ncbi:hypothetical protein [Shimia sagamensis]|uniref:Uncharacterized protein n=1 Tax=Shimia sagamensis TaxID=1566352 RepID=A0ABY1PDJ1_9RHOB|nr:hypothetical protein [Shimia sagamensis]SMP32110.1 hypothetical protein SAMN06265373_108130 [Shimia sagamensis]